MRSRGAFGVTTAALVLALSALCTPEVTGDTGRSTGGDLLKAGPIGVNGYRLHSLATADALRKPRRRATPAPFARSTPEEQGMDAAQLALAYERAAEIPRIYSMLVVRHRKLVAEQYFDVPSRHSAMPVASVCKSIVGALVGIALREGYLVNLDQRMIDFFPEYDLPSLDPRKRDITIRHLVQMRAGYPFDSNNAFFTPLNQSGNWIRFVIVDWQLERDPGTAMAYSNGSAHVLAGVLTRATRMSLIDFANLHVFEPMRHRIDHWPLDPQGYCNGMGDVRCTPLELATFGQMALDHGWWRGEQVLPQWWIDESLVRHSSSSYGSSIWPYQNIGYGQLWWHAVVDDHEIFFAWGHGGQFITLVPDLDLVVVTTADNFVGDFTNRSWATEGAIMRLIATDVIPAAY
jgi:CubicO group peptidase (beta-lactamase class C family)